MRITTTLRQLVIDTVNGFLEDDKPFSMFEITTAIRNLVNNDVVAIPELSSSAEFSYVVEHGEVKGLFQDLLASQAFNKELEKNWSGQYFVYAGIDATTVPTSVSTSVLSPSASGTSSSAPKLNLSEVISRVRIYLTNCNLRGTTPTLKQVQSAIKRGTQPVGWTCSDLSPIVTNIQNGTI